MEIKFSSVSVLYPYEQYPTIDGLDFTIDGQYNTLLIDIQSGKTTVAKLLMGLVQPTKGKICIDGTNICDIAPSTRRCAYLPYPPILFDNRSVLYNLEYPLKVRGIDKAERKKVATECAEKFNLLDLLNSKVKKLDDNTKMRIAIARLTVRPIDLLILDDCTGRLDDDNKQLLDNICQQSDITTICLTSDIRCAKGNIYLIQHSKLVSSGDWETVNKAKQQLLWLYDHDTQNCEVTNNEQQ